MATQTLTYTDNGDGSMTRTEIITDGINSRTTITVLSPSQAVQEQVKLQNQQMSIQAQLTTIATALVNLSPVIASVLAIQAKQATVPIQSSPPIIEP